MLTGDHVRARRILESVAGVGARSHEDARARVLRRASTMRSSWPSSSTRRACRRSPWTATPTQTTRLDADRRLRRGELRAIFTVDIFNEGVDIPEVDTLLLLRPTESATVFLQQLGRGLRWAEGKSVLTVLDFIGQAHADYRFDVRYRAMVGGTRRQVERPSSTASRSCRRAARFGWTRSPRRSCWKICGQRSGTRGGRWSMTSRTAGRRRRWRSSSTQSSFDLPDVYANPASRHDLHGGTARGRAPPRRAGAGRGRVREGARQAAARRRRGAISAVAIVAHAPSAARCCRLRTPGKSAPADALRGARVSGSDRSRDRARCSPSCGGRRRCARSSSICSTCFASEFDSASQPIDPTGIVPDPQSCDVRPLRDHRRLRIVEQRRASREPRRPRSGRRHIRSDLFFITLEQVGRGLLANDALSGLPDLADALPLGVPVPNHDGVAHGPAVRQPRRPRLAGHPVRSREQATTSAMSATPYLCLGPARHVSHKSESPSRSSGNSSALCRPTYFQEAKLAAG